MADSLLPPHLRGGEFVPPLLRTQIYLTPQLPNFRVPKEFWEDVIAERNGRSGHFNEHHVFFYRASYTTKLQRDFRNLPQNREVLTVIAHNYYHHNFIPPVKPPTSVMAETMLDALGLKARQGKRFLKRRYGMELE